MAVAEVLHPYYPVGVLLSGEVFVANDWHFRTLVLTLAGACAVVLAVALGIAHAVNPGLKNPDRLLVSWFVVCGFIHLFFEGYFVVNHTRMASLQDLFGQLWKEYALSDSRYLFSDPFVLCMESITAITWGPLSFLTAILIIKDSPFRHPIQALVSTGQFYGDILYYTTSLFDEFYSGKTYYRPEPYYFWFYFVFMNAFWLIVPAMCVYSSIQATAQAFRVSRTVAVNGSAKKNS